jgi:ATP/maltotriose-dependent transcriptional regulator MalT
MMTVAPLTRSRLHVRLEAAARFPATIVCAPEGFGKTTAIRQFLDARAGATLELGLLPEDGTISSFARALAETLAPVAPGLRTSHAHAIEFATQSEHPEEELAIWFLGHLDRDARITVFIDDLHHGSKDERIFALLQRLVKEAAAGYRWIFASRSLPTVTLHWRDLNLCAAPLTESELCLTEAEMSEIAAWMGLSPPDTRSLHEMTGGWPLAFSLGSSYPGWIPRLQLLRPTSAEGLYTFLAQEFFLECDPRLRELLLNTCVFSTIDRELIEASPWADSWHDVAQLANDGRFLSLRHDSSIKCRDLFRQFLEERLREQGEHAFEDACAIAAGLLEECNRTADALRLYARACNHAGILGICERYGFDLIDEGRLDDLQAALSLVDAATTAQSAVALAIKAIAESNLSRNDIAESWYLHALERADDTVVRAQIAYRYALDLVRRGRLDAVSLLEPYLNEALPLELDAELRSSLAGAYVIAGRFDDARRVIATAVALLDVSSSRQLEAKIQQVAAWVALFTGDVAAARARATHAVSIALECNLYEIAARAYAILYNISYDVEDNAETTLEIIDHILDCGVKAGNGSLRLFALLGSIDIRSEAGDIEGIRSIEKILDELGIDYSDRWTSECLLPAQALSLVAGQGDFVQAYRILFPTGERQATADRRALRFSEVALYAAAGGLKVEAESALLEVRRRLLECDPRARRTHRTQLNRAVALQLLGRIWEANAIMQDLGRSVDAMSDRLLALYDCVVAVFRHWDGADNYNDIYDALAQMQKLHLGGVASAIAALPRRRERTKIA